ncbi:hypothetical protein CAMRE0001_1885 [Campylobacter rectus RM3267]|uniref:Uncharacterized protein n=1 Tax=Campylobacter rectus RM3267 TaxID=553218 RepID=B9CYQ4_CAMRE|nr:hypothetical protein CAMRE0001_1885 [Campylobacter rectus RM3267]
MIFSIRVHCDAQTYPIVILDIARFGLYDRAARLVSGSHNPAEKPGLRRLNLS